MVSALAVLHETTMAAPPQESYKAELIKHSMSVGALKFGSFTLKSGRCVTFP